jgi:hypothetical protein
MIYLRLPGEPNAGYEAGTQTDRTILDTAGSGLARKICSEIGFLR